MNEYTVTLKPVYSCPASNLPNELKLPHNWTLSWHQLKTYQAINDPSIDVIFNTAMTGDGKSLAVFLNTLISYFTVLGLYPTNELARDQLCQIQGYIEQFNPTDSPRLNRLSGAELELYAEQEKLSKATAIATRTHQSEILLTNPDIFHYLHHGAYLTPYDNPDKLWNRIDKNFDLILIDEFHVLSAPQVASILNTMLLIRRTNRQKKYVFLSATPDKLILDKLTTAGFKVHCIDPVAEEKYQFPDNSQQIEEIRSQGWRQILREIQLNFIPLEPSFQASEDWLKANQEQILEYFLTNPHTKGAIILNSIASVKRLVPLFRELLAPHGLTVGENTGLSGKQDKINSLSCDLVLGTSTIDVGVDFKINLLIFESSDAGNFIQRLGRLGRHDGYDKNGEAVKFSNYTAIALVPKFLVERLFDKDPAPLIFDRRYERPYFNDVIRANYRKIHNFEGYYKRWGAVQSFSLWWNLGKPTIKQQYGTRREQFRVDCETVFERDLGKVAGQIRYWGQEWETLSRTKGNPIFDDASSFRGFSPLSCGLYDLTEKYEGDRFKTYDLPGILSNLDIETTTEKGFLGTLQETSDRINQPIPKGQFRHCLAFMKLKGYREERLNWRFIYADDLKEIADAWKVQVLIGVEIWQPDNHWIGEINRKLKRTGLVSYVLPKPVMEVRQRLQLPMHFALYPISDSTSLLDATSPYSIAISQSALLLDTLAYRLKSKGGEIWVC